LILKRCNYKKGVVVQKALHEQVRGKLEKLRENQMKTKCVMENSTKVKAPQRKKYGRLKFAKIYFI